MNATVSAPSSTAGLDAWLRYLEALHPSEIELGLERVERVRQRLAIDPAPAQVITVAGTNGKGSTVRYLETMLRAAGYRTGVYISPHLRVYEERVRVNGVQLDAGEHVRAFQAVEQARQDTSLTYFEFGTLAAFWLMQQQALDVWILEVGLGGRLDAVNCIDPDVGIVTSVGIDHIGFLGDDRTGIAREKAGIFRPGKAAVIGEPDFPAEVFSALAARDIHPVRVGTDFDYQLAADGQSWRFSGRHSQLHDLPLPSLPLPNAATALMALELLPLPVSEQALRQGLLCASEAGRLQFVAGDPDYLLDVAHNPHAAAFLANYLQQRFPQRPVFAVVGMLKDKDIPGTLAELTPVVERWFVADLEGPRGAAAAELAAALPGASVHEFPAVTAAFQAACQAARESDSQPLVLVCGSFYTVAKIPEAE
ncbi:bifunctional tetrahydrofolate synthase/dihydrofolate synthase [Pseudidiomarina sp. 1APP75-32.1]|uniref:Dihydrofolate synthase/folylpolyglutamate synthase n=1 Tax=Pseudidiomarina terrestris TaxID=2820060 RepID=A0AAW7QWU9_9GAMM|nr:MULTISPECIES: bifunctional tetrahydrofolate synthase/dihydrofolate synthase [unclassified Pseudidiomarina]MDN7124700.1 bifunctional tetrahydrofolate synthase/dihydrofolate synthase [Pseudidiomarina sp. 1APP75-32.1]MDN7129009.1 bifunctional tetrahydrofolate synthase/dihydrofolate synthase [Pseudidiomarina sp. 1APR75-15]